MQKQFIQAIEDVSIFTSYKGSQGIIYAGEIFEVADSRTDGKIIDYKIKAKTRWIDGRHFQKIDIKDVLKQNGFNELVNVIKNK